MSYSNMKFIQEYTYLNQDRREVHTFLLLQEETDLLSEVGDTKESVTCGYVDWDKKQYPLNRSDTIVPEN